MSASVLTGDRFAYHAKPHRTSEREALYDGAVFSFLKYDGDYAVLHCLHDHTEHSIPLDEFNDAYFWRRQEGTK